MTLSSDLVRIRIELKNIVTEVLNAEKKRLNAARDISKTFKFISYTVTDLSKDLSKDTRIVKDLVKELEHERYFTHIIRKDQTYLLNIVKIILDELKRASIDILLKNQLISILNILQGIIRKVRDKIRKLEDLIRKAEKIENIGESNYSEKSIIQVRNILRDIWKIDYYLFTMLKGIYSEKIDKLDWLKPHRFIYNYGIRKKLKLTGMNLPEIIHQLKSDPNSYKKPEQKLFIDLVEYIVLYLGILTRDTLYIADVENQIES